MLELETWLPALFTLILYSFFDRQGDISFASRLIILHRGSREPDSGLLEWPAMRYPVYPAQPSRSLVTVSTSFHKYLPVGTGGRVLCRLLPTYGVNSPKLGVRAAHPLIWPFLCAPYSLVGKVKTSFNRIRNSLNYILVKYKQLGRVVWTFSVCELPKCHFIISRVLIYMAKPSVPLDLYFPITYRVIILLPAQTIFYIVREQGEIMTTCPQYMLALKAHGKLAVIERI